MLIAATVRIACVVDAQGRAVALTTTIEAAFGARRMVTTDAARPGGFLLNNQLTDFSFAPTGADGRPVANRAQPGKRPRSSMSPTLVFDKATGQLLMSGGSPGLWRRIRWCRSCKAGSGSVPRSAFRGSWRPSRATASPRRYLIADEVGLGKTIETALILRELASRGELSRALMVVPAGLVNNWHRELNDVFNLDFEVFG